MNSDKKQKCLSAFIGGHRSCFSSTCEQFAIQGGLGAGDAVPTVIPLHTGSGGGFDAGTPGGGGQQVFDGGGHFPGGVHQHEILAGEKIEAVDAGGRADHGFAHGHGFQHLDVGAGGSDERRHYESGALVGGANIGDETFERDAGLRQIGSDGVPLVPRAGDDVERRVVEQGPYIVDEEFHRHDVGTVGEAADEEDAAGGQA